MAKIITKATSDELADWIATSLVTFPSKLIRIEGICGSGKTTIGSKLAARGGGLHIEADKFAVQQQHSKAYAKCLKRSELDTFIELAIRTGRTVILDAVCLGDVAPEERWGRGLKIYVKRLSFNNADPLWHEGFNLEEKPPAKEPHRSVHLYHAASSPHMNADIIVEFPEDGHEISKVPFSRERCFDPVGSVVAY